MATDRHQAPSYPLRMPDELKNRVSESAAANGRSLHAELILRLNESFRRNKDDADEMKARLEVAEAKVAEHAAMAKAIYLAYGVDFLLQGMRGPDPKGVLKLLSYEVSLIEEAAAGALKYEAALNPELRLEAFRREIEATKDLLRKWQPDMLPFLGSPEEEVPKKKASRARKG